MVCALLRVWNGCFCELPLPESLDRMISAHVSGGILRIVIQSTFSKIRYDQWFNGAKAGRADIVCNFI